MPICFNSLDNEEFLIERYAINCMNESSDKNTFQLLEVKKRRN